MVVSDTVKIIVLVSAPAVFFALLFLLAYLWRRRRSSYRKGRFSKSSGQEQGRVWDPSGRERVLPQCHLCFESHRNHRMDPPDAGRTVPEHFVREGEASISIRGDLEAPSFAEKIEIIGISQPHFRETPLSVRRIGSDPHAPDQITRVNSVSSSLLPNSIEPAYSSSDVLPYGGGRRGSHASTVKPSFVGHGGMEANSLSSGVVAVGDRRPSVLSGGLADRPESDRLSVRRVSIGGTDETVSIRGANLDPSTLPVRTIPYFSQYRASSIPKENDIKPKLNVSIQLPPTQPPPSDSLSTSSSKESTSPSPHPFSAASLSRHSIISQPPITFAVPHIRVSQRYRYPNRPGTLKLASTAVKQIDRDTSPALPSGRSVKGLKSAPLRTADTNRTMDSTSSFGDAALLAKSGPSEQQGMFDGWKGFQSKGDDQGIPQDRLKDIPEVQVPISPTTATQKPQTGTPAQALDQLTRGPSLGKHVQPGAPGEPTQGAAGSKIEATTTPQTHRARTSDASASNGLQVEVADSSRISMNSTTSRITYLSDLVKTDSATSSRRTSITPDETKPLAPLPPAHVNDSGLRKSILKTRSSSSSRSRPESGSGLNVALAAGMGMGVAVGLGSGAGAGSTTKAEA